MMISANSEGQLDYTANFLKQFEDLYLNANFSDVTFIVEEEKVPAHKLILMVRSSYFRSLITSNSTKLPKDVIELDVSLEAFKHALRFMYTGQISLPQIDYATILDLLRLAYEYTIEDFLSAIQTFLTNNLSLENCCDVLHAASLFDSKLKDVALTFIDRNAPQIISDVKFTTLSRRSLCFLSKRDSFYAPEVDIFKAILEWRKCNKNVDVIRMEDIISHIRFNLMEFEDLFAIVRKSSLLTNARLLDVIEAKTTTENWNYRGILKPDVNIATVGIDAKTSSRIMVNGNYIEDDGTIYISGSHEITGSNENSIIVELPDIYIINQLTMLLYNQDDAASYSYYIEVSVNRKSWKRVIDHSNFHCRSWQYLYFKSCPVRYIKLLGTRNEINNIFDVMHLEAFYKTQLVTLTNGLVSPSRNVASVGEGANVIEGHCSSYDTLNVMLNGNYDKYTTYSGFTCEDIHRPIIIQLAQTYHIGSLRLLLCDLDDGTYSFYIETSTDLTNWQMAVDKRNEKLRSWQQFTFESRPVNFFRLVGTYHNANDGLHVVHFEAPYVPEGEISGNKQ